MIDKAKNQTDSYDELIEKYNTLIKVCKIVMHDVRSPLRFLGDVAESLDLDKVSDPESEHRKNLLLLIDTCRNLYFFSTDVLDWFVNNKLEISLMKENLSLDIVIQEIIGLYDKQIKKKHIKLILDIDKGAVVYTNKEISSIIFRNALDNAIKYTNDGQIKITLQKESDIISLCIEDTGKGFDHKRLLHNLSDSNPATAQHIGFRIINDLAIQVGVLYELTSEKGVGTTFILKYPLAKKLANQTIPKKDNIKINS